MSSLPYTTLSEHHLQPLWTEACYLCIIHLSYPMSGDNAVFHPEKLWYPTSLKILELECTGSILPNGHLSSKFPKALLHHLNNPFLYHLEHHMGCIKDTWHNLRRDELA